MLIIDGNNLWYAAMHLGEPLAGIGRGNFVRVLDRFAQAAGRRVVVVLDGHRPASTPEQTELRGGAERVYAAGESADAVISRLVADSTEPRRLTLVSSDRSLLRQVRKRRVKVIESDVFAARLESWLSRPPSRAGGREPAGKLTGLGGVRESIDEWLKFLDLPPVPSDIIRGEEVSKGEESPLEPRRAGSTEDGGQSQSESISDPSPSPDVSKREQSRLEPQPVEEDGLDARDDLGRALQDVQPLKRRRRRPGRRRGR